jgi:hypothetical protein
LLQKADVALIARVRAKKRQREVHVFRRGLEEKKEFKWEYASSEERDLEEKKESNSEPSEGSGSTRGREFKTRKVSSAQETHPGKRVL